MGEVKVWLSSNGLGEYWPNFEEHGWEELSLLTEMSEVELEVCITKAGHRAKFRKALRSLTNAFASSGNSESPSHADERQKFPCEMGTMPVVNTTSSLTQRTGTLTQLSRAESKDTFPKEDDAESMETVQKTDTGLGQIDAVHEVDNTGTDPADTVQEIDKADSEAIVRDVKDALRIADDNRTETEPNVTIPNRNEVSRFEESRTASNTSSDLSLSPELAAMGPSFTVIGDRVLEGPFPQGIEREPPNITVIERSENTTVYQGPTQLYVAPDDDSTNPAVNLKGKMEILADWDRSKDHRYVETKAFKALKSVVEEMHWATLLGKPGDGKSATAAHLLLQYTAREYEPVFLSSPSDWKMLISASPSSRQIAVVDDMFGQSYLDDNGFVKEWKSSVDNMSKIVKQRNGNLLVICTSRRYIFKDIETSLGKFPCFSKHTIVDMTDDQYKLSGDEKVAIFKKFAEAFSIETNTWLERGIRNVDPPHGFPHCAELYCSNAFLQQEGIFFFKNPVQYVQREICNFRDNDRVKFLVLLLVLHNGDKLGLDTLDELIENTTDDDKKFFQTAGVSLETAIPDIHKAVTGLTNTYLRLNNDGSYSFSHHSLRETVAHIYISANPTHAIRALEFQHIVAFTLTQKETAKGTVSKRSLPFKPLAKRMITEIKDGHVSTVCDWEVWSDQTFVINFVKSIENEPLDFLEEMICSKRTATRVTESNSFLKSLIQRKRYIAAESFLKNKSIGKTLQNSDLWVKCLQKGLETAGYASYGINPNIAMIRSLVSIRFGENMQKLDGSIVLSDMLYYSNAEIADVLLDHTYINPQNSQYFHSLANSQIDLPQFKVLCKKLRQAGVDINQIDRMDVPAVFKCLTRFEDNVLDRLLCMVNNGANIHKQCKNGNIVLCTVRTMPSPPCINILTKLSDLDVNFHCTDSTGSNVLHIMCERRPDEGSRALLDYLLNKGAAAGAVNDRGVVPLMLALKNNFSIDVIKTLSKSNPPNHVDKAGQGYFHYLLSSPRITNADEFCDKCEILLKLGSSINGIDNLEKPPLVHLMEQQFYKSYQPHTFHRLDTKYDFVKMFKFLYEHGMDLHVKDSCGRNIVLCVLDWKITEDVLPLLHYLHSIERLDFKLIDDNERNALHHLFANVFYNDVVLEAQEYYEVTEREFPEVSGNMLKEIYDFVTLISPKIKTTFIRVFILNGRKN